jgi:hypothetical protein
MPLVTILYYNITAYKGDFCFLLEAHLTRRENVSYNKFYARKILFAILIDG